jgi:hypothetical protein
VLANVVKRVRKKWASNVKFSSCVPFHELDVVC